jgi:tyrosyl-tRNA synthetase
LQVGGATGLVGDPSGRLTERVLDSTVKIGENVVSLTTAIERFFRNGRAYANARLAKNTVDVPPPTVVNNLDWYRNMSFIDFLREIGTKARVNSMLARER